MANNNIDSFGNFLNYFYEQNALLKEVLNDWDAVLNTGLIMVRDLEKMCDCDNAKPSLVFLKEVFSAGHGLSFSIYNRFDILRDIAERNRYRRFNA
jgi:hypothetical protein